MIFKPCAFLLRRGGFFRLLPVTALVALVSPLHSAATPVCDAPEHRVALQLQANPPINTQACDLNGLEKLPSREISTSLPPSLGMPGVHRWKGVSLRRLIEMMGGGEHSQIQLTALNDYAIDIPWSDLVHYDPIVAYSRNQQRMSIRDKGPLILIYPFDSTPQLQVQKYVNRSIWQINAISIR